MPFWSMNGRHSKSTLLLIERFNFPSSEYIFIRLNVICPPVRRVGCTVNRCYHHGVALWKACLLAAGRVGHRDHFVSKVSHVYPVRPLCLSPKRESGQSPEWWRAGG